MENFTLYNPTKLHFGKGQIKALYKELENYNRVLFVYGSGSIKKNGLYDEVKDILTETKKEVYELSGIDPNPRLTSVRKGIQMVNDFNIDLILAVGGGSTIDCAKAIVVSAYSKDDINEILRDRIPIKKGLGLGTILTLSATGTEMNPRSVISDMESNLKLGIGFWEVNATYPDFSICDPTYTISVPKNQTINGIVDTISHILEQYFTVNDNNIVGDKFAESLLTTMIEIGPKLIDDLENYKLRETMMISSTLAWNGLLRGLLNKGDWACHRMEHALSAVFDIPHGEGLAILTPIWMAYVKQYKPDKFYDLGKNVFKIDVENKEVDEVADLTIDEFKKFLGKLDAPQSMKHYHINDFDLNELVQKTMLGQKTIGKYVELNEKDVYYILSKIF